MYLKIEISLFHSHNFCRYSKHIKYVRPFCCCRPYYRFVAYFVVVVLQLLGRSSGFQVASTHRPCTKGLWLWSSPLKRTALDGTEYNLLLLDSEGIDAYDQTVCFFQFSKCLLCLLSGVHVGSLFLIIATLSYSGFYFTTQGTYSTQIFSLAVLLSSMFIYNQVGTAYQDLYFFRKNDLFYCLL